jgi:hypothetical protein
VALHRPAAEQASGRADATGTAQASGTQAGAAANSQQQLMADDRVVFVLHRMITVSRDSDRAAAKGAGRPDAPYVFKDATVQFNVREADEVEARVEQLRLKAAVDERVEELRLKAAVDRRVAELRQQADRDDDD